MDVFHSIQLRNARGMRDAQGEKSLCVGLLLVPLLVTLGFHLQSPEQGLK